MDFGNGGYVLLRLPDGAELTAKTGKTVTVSKDVVAKLKQFDKPVLFEHFTFTVGGGNREMCGYSIHTVEAGVHKHYIGSMTISVVGDNQITMYHE